MPGKGLPKNVDWAGGRHQVVEEHSEGSGHQECQHDRERGLTSPAEMRGIDQRQRQGQSNIKQEAGEPEPQVPREYLPHQKTELHAETAINGIQIKIERLRMQRLGVVQQGRSHVLRGYEEDCWKKCMQQK